MNDLFIERDACISQCGKYRWSLSRNWDWRKPWLGWIMLNPSTADASQDDPTIRRCIGFAADWGFGGIAVRNIFAYRATDPDELLRTADPIGSENDKAILDLIGVCPMIVAAWGALGSSTPRAKHVYQMFYRRTHPLQCLGMTKAGEPSHPLYVPASRKPGLYLRYLQGGHGCPTSPTL